MATMNTSRNKIVVVHVCVSVCMCVCDQACRGLRSRCVSHEGPKQENRRSRQSKHSTQALKMKSTVPSFIDSAIEKVSPRKTERMNHQNTTVIIGPATKIIAPA